MLDRTPAHYDDCSPDFTYDDVDPDADADTIPAPELTGCADCGRDAYPLELKQTSETHSGAPWLSCPECRAEQAAEHGRNAALVILAAGLSGLSVPAGVPFVEMLGVV